MRVILPATSGVIETVLLELTVWFIPFKKFTVPPAAVAINKLVVPVELEASRVPVPVKEKEPALF